MCLFCDKHMGYLMMAPVNKNEKIDSTIFFELEKFDCLSRTRSCILNSCVEFDSMLNCPKWKLKLVT